MLCVQFINRLSETFSETIKVALRAATEFLVFFEWLSFGIYLSPS